MELFLRMVPPNIFGAAAEGQMLGIITFALLYGFFAGRLGFLHRRSHLSFWESFFAVMMAMVEFILRFAPLGVFALVAEVAATTGWGALRPLAAFALTVILALALHAFGTLPLLLRFLAGVRFRPHFKAVSPALLTAFSTSSSSATLPVTLECVEKRAGVSNQVSGFVLPLGATVNMDGTALYECVAVLFIAQAYGIELSLATQFAVVWLALMTSIGVAGVPAASLVAIVIILRSAGIPLEGIGLILAVDRVLDMLRTGVNVWSDTCGAAVLQRWMKGKAKVF